MTKYKDKFIEILKTTPLTVDEIARELNLDDTFMVLSMLAELEYDKKVTMCGFKTCYEPDGCAFYIAKYGLITNDKIQKETGSN